MEKYLSISGTIISIESFPISVNDTSACTLIIGVQSSNRDLNYFILDQNTYFVNHVTLKKGDYITAFYDSMAPAPLIFPPRYRAVVIVPALRHSFIKVAYFNEKLVSGDEQLKLNIGPRTRILLPNNQIFLGKLGNQDLVVIYGPSTKSIPAQTTPMEVIVLC